MMTDKQGITTLLLFTVGCMLVFCVGIYIFALAWHDQNPSLLYFLWMLPGFGLMLYALFYVNRINRNDKKT